jgi:hypothetical protein
MSVSFLLVSCCLEPSRLDVLKQVVANLQNEASEIVSSVTVFDNASTQPGVAELLCDTFKNVYVSEQNVGYWTAVDWWLTHINKNQPEFTYIIESDMIHYDFHKFWKAENFLKSNKEIGAVRLHEYSVKNKHIYNKDAPHPDSRKSMWVSHNNKVTNKPIIIDSSLAVDDIHPANFLTHLPALNRYETLVRAFATLRDFSEFNEVDFQRLYHNEYQINSICDGGIFHCDLGSHSSNTVTGSWTSPDKLKQMGYLLTRYASIKQPNKYNVHRLK